MPLINFLLFLFHALAQAETPADLIQEKLGTWSSTTEVKGTMLSSKTYTLQTTVEATMILNENYLEENTIGDAQGKAITTYDPKTNIMYQWNFDGQGIPTFWIGKYNKRKSTTTWELYGNDELKGKIKEKRINENKYEVHVVLRTLTDQIVFEARTTKERK